MSDLISRQKAIEALGEKPVGESDWDLGCRNQWGRDTEILRTLPSAEPERKIGKWIYKPNEYDDSTYECSQCGEPWTLIDGTPAENNMNFCPNCGARMEREYENL